MTRKEQAMDYFKEGYNCAQAVLLAFEDIVEVDKKTLLRLSSSFGGGMGRLREVCGVCSSIFMVAGFLLGYEDSEDMYEKQKHYAFIQLLASDFKDELGSIICRELIESEEPISSKPEERTAEYYKKRPCVEIVGIGTEILERRLKEKGKI